LTDILNWTSLIFSSPANLIVPFALFLVSKRYKASATLGNINFGQYLAGEHVIPLQLVATGATESTETLSATPPTPTGNAKSVDNLIITSPTPQSTLKPGDLTVEPTAGPSSNVVRTVRSPSIHRDYGLMRAREDTALGPRQSLVARSGQPLLPRVESPRLKEEKEEDEAEEEESPQDQDKFRLSIPLPSPNQANDEFRLSPLSISPIQETNDFRTSLGRSPVVAMSPIPATVPTFEAFPSLRSSKWLQPRWLAAAECVIIIVLVVAALVLNIIQAV
jgi:hypothetical protein